MPVHANGMGDGLAGVRRFNDQRNAPRIQRSIGTNLAPSTARTWECPHDCGKAAVLPEWVEGVQHQCRKAHDIVSLELKIVPTTARSIAIDATKAKKAARHG